MKILILSACSRFRTPAFLNHRYFAECHEYEYIYEFLPLQVNIQSRYLYKLYVLAKYANFTSFDFIFWVDDDVLFVDFDSKMPLERILIEREKYHLIFSESPTHLKYKFKCWINSGNFFFKPSTIVKEFFDKCTNTCLDQVRHVWNRDKYGPFFGGDQEIMTHLLNDASCPAPPFTRTNFKLFNTRPYHYGVLENLILIHFTAGSKALQMKKFAKNHHFTNNALLPTDVLNNYLRTCDPLLTIPLRVKRHHFDIWTLWSFKLIFLALLKIVLLK